MTDVLSEIGIAVTAGVLAGLIVLAAQRVGQWWIDRRVAWPFIIRIAAKANRALPRYQFRIRIFNRASTEAHFVMTPLSSPGQTVNGWNVLKPWGYTPAGIVVSVPPRAWTEFWMEGPNAADGSPPAQVKFDAWFFTDERARSLSLKATYSE